MSSAHAGGESFAEAEQPRRHARDGRPGRNIRRHHRARSDHGPLPDLNPAEDYDARPDARPPTDSGRLALPVVPPFQ